MKLDLTGLRMEVTEAMKEFTEKKIEKLNKFFDEDTICHVTIAKGKNLQNLDIRIEYKSRTYLAEKETDDIYKGIVELVEVLEGQLRKNKAILEKKRRDGATEEQLDALKIEDLIDED